MVQPKAWFNDDVLLEYGELPHVLQILILVRSVPASSPYGLNWELIEGLWD